MMSEKYMTIVIKYEGEPPIKGFGIPVLGCEVTALSLRDEFEVVDILQGKLETLRGEDDDEDE